MAAEDQKLKDEIHEALKKMAESVVGTVIQVYQQSGRATEMVESVGLGESLSHTNNEMIEGQLLPFLSLKKEEMVLAVAKMLLEDPLWFKRLKGKTTELDLVFQRLERNIKDRDTAISQARNDTLNDNTQAASSPSVSTDEPKPKKRKP